MCARQIYPAQRGFGLVEAMVGMLIGMITVVVIMQTLANSEQTRRATTSSSDANVTGALALQTLQRDLLNAGFGLTVDTDLYSRCGGRPVLGFNASRSTPAISLNASIFTPLQIFPAGSPELAASGYAAPDANTDVIQVTYSGSTSFLGRGIGVGAVAAGSEQDFTIVDDPENDGRGRAGLHPGDLIVALPCSAPASGGTCTTPPGQSCTLSLVTSVDPKTSTAANSLKPAIECATDGALINYKLIRHASGDYRNYYETDGAGRCVSRPNVWNEGASLNRGQVFLGAKLYSLGPPERVVIRAYAVRNGNLTVCSPLFQNCAQANEWDIVGEHIVSMRAQYGYDDGIPASLTPPNGKIEAGEWFRKLAVPPLVANVNWAQLKAIRVVLVGRSSEISREAPNPAPDCTPTWIGYPTDAGGADSACTGAAGNGQIVLNTAPDGGNWNRYRYKVFETTIQLRNLFWSDN